MNELILAIVGFVAALVGAAFVGSKLNEGKHRKEVITDQSNALLDLTGLLHYHDRISKDEIEAIQEIPNVNIDDIGRVLHEWPEVSGVFAKPGKATVKRNKAKKLQG